MSVCTKLRQLEMLSLPSCFLFSLPLPFVGVYRSQFFWQSGCTSTPKSTLGKISEDKLKHLKNYLNQPIWLCLKWIKKYLGKLFPECSWGCGSLSHWWAVRSTLGGLSSPSGMGSGSGYLFQNRISVLFLLFQSLPFFIWGYHIPRLYLWLSPGFR